MDLMSSFNRGTAKNVGPCDRKLFRTPQTLIYNIKMFSGANGHSQVLKIIQTSAPPPLAPDDAPVIQTASAHNSATPNHSHFSSLFCTAAYLSHPHNTLYKIGIWLVRRSFGRRPTEVGAWLDLLAKHTICWW